LSDAAAASETECCGTSSWTYGSPPAGVGAGLGVRVRRPLHQRSPNNRSRSEGNPTGRDMRTATPASARVDVHVALSRERQGGGVGNAHGHGVGVGEHPDVGFARAHTPSLGSQLVDQASACTSTTRPGRNGACTGYVVARGSPRFDKNTRRRRPIRVCGDRVQSDTVTCERRRRWHPCTTRGARTMNTTSAASERAR